MVRKVCWHAVHGDGGGGDGDGGGGGGGGGGGDGDGGDDGGGDGDGDGEGDGNYEGDDDYDDKQQNLFTHGAVSLLYYATLSLCHWWLCMSNDQSCPWFLALASACSHLVQCSDRQRWVCCL